MLFLYLILIIFSCFVLTKATEILIDALERIAKSSHLGKFGLAALMMALATSLPELFVSLAAAWSGETNLVLGNIIGSNIADLSLIIGGTAILGGSLPVVGNFLKKDIFYTFLAGSLPLLLLLDNQLTRVDGLVLLVVYLWYNLTVMSEKRGREKDGPPTGGQGSRIFSGKILRGLKSRVPGRDLGWFFLGIILLLFSAEMIVRIAKQMAGLFKLPMILIGLFLVAVGTSLPELVFGLEAVRKKEVEMVFGNLLGSVVANSTLILGLAALISPIKIQYLNHYLVATMAFLIIFGVFWSFVKSKRKLERWEGGVLFLIYLLFAAAEILGK